MGIQEARIRNLLAAIKETRLNVADFAKSHDIDASYISQLINKHRGFGEKAARNMEKKAGLPPMSLDADDAFATNVEPASMGRRMVPIINEVQAGNWREIREGFHTAEMLITDLDLSPFAFALTIRGKSMEPDFLDGDRVIIDPEVSPVPGDCVAAINGGNEATFKKYRERGTGLNGQTIFDLVPINPDYPTLRSDVESISIIGTMMELRKYRRRT